MKLPEMCAEDQNDHEGKRTMLPGLDELLLSESLDLAVAEPGAWHHRGNTDEIGRRTRTRVSSFSLWLGVC